MGLAADALAAVAVLVFIALPCTRADDTDVALFDAYLKQFNKSYERESSEYYERLDYFKESLKRHAQLNEGVTGVKYGVNKFSDMSQSEFKAMYLTGIQKNPSPASMVPDPAEHDASRLRWNLGFSSDDLPPKWDWRDKGIVTAVKDQKHCGGCWAFSAVETLESAAALQWNISNPAVLSVQEVVDCATNNYGCNGGNVAPAYDWLIETGMPLVEESKYPVTDKPEYCAYFAQPIAGVFLTNYSCQRFVGAEDQLRQHLYRFGPVAAVVDATTWSDYIGGIIQWHCTDNTNHYVQLVGFDMTGPVPYYIARNSWGSDWGNNGYLYIKTDGNVCGVAETVCEVLGTKLSS